MAEREHSDTTGVRKALRPVLIASPQTMSEYAPFLRRLLVGLADESISAALICPPDGGVESVIPAPVEVLNYPSIDLPLMEHVGLETLATQLERFKPTMLHCLCESRASLTRRLARRLDIPYVLAINSLPGKVRRLSISPERCAKIIVPTDTIASSIVRSYSHLANRVKRIHMGTFAGSHPVCFPDTSRLSSIVVAHRLDHVSDFQALLSAAKVLFAEGREFVMAIMGSGRAEHRLRTALAEHGLTSVTTIVPMLDPWRSVLAAGDIFVHLRPEPAFSGFLLEAMGLGAAVVACKGGVDDLILHEKTALLYEPKNATSLRQALVRLLDDHEYARQLAGSTQAHVRREYSVGNMISATLDTYVEIQRQDR